jgi:hypothetical protein
MYDVVILYLSSDTIRSIASWTLSLSALIIFFLAFAVTEGAGFHCPLALLRMVQRMILCALSIAAAYAAAFIVYLSWTPPGPILLLCIAFMASTLISAARHMLAPAIAADNTWSGAWRAAYDRLARPFPHPQPSSNIRRAR